MLNTLSDLSVSAPYPGRANMLKLTEALLKLSSSTHHFSGLGPALETAQPCEWVRRLLRPCRPAPDTEMGDGTSTLPRLGPSPPTFQASLRAPTSSHFTSLDCPTTSISMLAKRLALQVSSVSHSHSNRCNL